MSDTVERIKCLIIGSGPAGYTAAIYAARADLKPVVYTGLEPGGQLTTTTEVDNFPGYPEGIDGPAMMMQLQQQAERFGTEVRIGMATAVEFSSERGGIHKVTIDNSKKIEAESIIIATGATARYLGLPSEQRLRGGGVSACAVCDGFFYKGQDVAIVGGGDTAAEEATYLANICTKVTMLVRKGEMRASKAMQHRVDNTANLEVRYFSEIEEVIGDQVVEGIRIVNNQTGKKRRSKSPGSLLLSGINPIPISLKDNWIWMKQVTCSPKGNQRKRANPVFLPAEMFRIKNTDKPLRRPVRDVWLPWMLKDTLPK